MPITVKTFATKDEAVSVATDAFEALIRERAKAGKTAVLGLATGATPIALYKELIRRHKETGLSFKNVISFNLDEYCGLPGTHEQSYRYFMNEQLFNHVDILKANTHVPLGTLPDAEIDAHCKSYEEAIKAAGGIDIQLLGIGRTGHIGFNEPPSDPETRTRKVHLDELTRKDNASFFGDVAHVPHHAITMGCGTVIDAKKVILLAWGEAKADIVRKSLKDTPSAQVPASWLRQHKDCLFILDAAAASKI
jgi:glucosamine-6-phosphate deaminase